MTNQLSTDFAAAVVQTIRGVWHLFGQLDYLNNTLLRALRSDPHPLRLLLGTPLDRPMARLELDRQVRDQYHFLLAPRLSDASDAYQDDVEAEGDEVSGTQNARRKESSTWMADIEPTSTYLAVSVRLHDEERTIHEPHVRYMALRDWSVGSAARPHSDGLIAINRGQTLRMLRCIDVSDHHDFNRKIQTAGKAHRKTGRAVETLLWVRVPSPPKIVPLFQLEGLEAIELLARDMKVYWQEAAQCG